MSTIKINTMKKFISLMCIVLTFATLFCACNGEEPVETQPVTESVAATEPETTEKPAPAKKTTYIDLDGKIEVTNKRIPALDLRAFTQNTEYKGETYSVYYKNAQGGCIVGDYLYTCMHAWALDGVYPQMICVVKSNLKTGEIVAKTKGMPLGHGNDIAYNPDDNILVIADCGGNGKNILWLMDPDTLELKGSKTVSGSGSTICAIAYDEVNKRYVAVGAQNDYVHIYNRDFALIKEFKGYGMTKGDPYKGDFSGQGILTDGTYLYLLEWHGGPKWVDEGSIVWDKVRANILVTELSTGKHLATIDTTIDREVEFMGYRNGRLYIACNNQRWDGMEFYRVDITTTKN